MRQVSIRRPRPAVHIVDDDSHVRRAIWYALESAGYAPRVFTCGDDLLVELEHLAVAPLLVDLQLPDIDGFALLERVRHRAPLTPVIMLTGYGNVACAVAAMKAGAIDFLEKPVDTQRLIEAVASASQRLEASAAQDRAFVEASQRVAALTMREEQVLARLAAGKSNKLIAFELGLSIRTIEMHRVRMMRRLAVRNLPDALRLAHLAGIGALRSGERARRTA